jgi:2-oxoacid:acceptor oxidoreductase delta subunit (pyruvate/2-ketoisovalerate family)
LTIQSGLVEITVWYRGVVEGRLARQVSNGLADAALAEGKHVQAFDNYVDLPDRVGVPCRSYARVCATPIEEPYLYENHNPSIVICTDAALVQGCNVLKGLEPGGALIINTARTPEFILGLLEGLSGVPRLRTVATLDAGSAHQPNVPQGGIEGSTEKAAAMHTASLLLGAIAHVTGVVKLETMLSRSSDKTAIKEGFDRVTIQKNPKYDPKAAAEPAGEEAFRGRVDLVVPSPKPGGTQPGHITGNYRMQRPVVDQEACSACRTCWAACPDSCMAVDPKGDVKVSINLDFCKGCGICWQVCPLGCITPKEEVEFEGGVTRLTY